MTNLEKDNVKHNSQDRNSKLTTNFSLLGPCFFELFLNLIPRVVNLQDIMKLKVAF